MGQAGAKDGRIVKTGVKLVFGERKDFAEIELGPVGIKSKVFVGTGWGLLLARAGEETFAAAEKVIADFGGEVGWDFGVGLDSEIADTFSGVEGAIGSKSTCRAGDDAFVAAGAGLRDRFIGVEGQIGNQLSQKNLRAETRID